MMIPHGQYITFDSPHGYFDDFEFPKLVREAEKNGVSMAFGGTIHIFPEGGHKRTYFTDESLILSGKEAFELISNENWIAPRLFGTLIKQELVQDRLVENEYEFILNAVSKSEKVLLYGGYVSYIDAAYDDFSNSTQQLNLPAWFKGDRQRAAFMSSFVNLSKSDKSRVFLFGVPEHANLGDQAIAMSTIQFVKSVLPDIEVVEITERQLEVDIDNIRNFVEDNDLLLLMGGGNLGDLYMGPALARQAVIETFPNNAIILFPNSMYFKHQENLNKCKTLFASHKNLTLFAREEVSFKLMSECFYANKVFLAPDIVLSLPATEPCHTPGSGAVLAMRIDQESYITSERLSDLKSLITNRFGDFVLTDTIIRHKAMCRKTELDKKLRQFSEAKLLVTDRLHGAIFAALTGTSCIVLPNSYHKVEGVCKWIEHLPYVKLCHSIQDVELVLTEDFLTTAHENCEITSQGAFNPLIDSLKRWYNGKV